MDEDNLPVETKRIEFYETPGDGADPEQPGEEPDRDDEVSKARMELYDWLQCIVSAIICGIFIFVFVGRTIGVDGRSMLYTLHHKDRVVMSNLLYTPHNGDIVVFHCPYESFGGTPLVKRVIAIAGQTIDINFDTGEVFVYETGSDPAYKVALYEPYIAELTTNRHSFEGPLEVKDGFIFVMGDNRNSSSDSRDLRIGLVDTRYILGRVYFVLIPGQEEDGRRDWSRFGVPQ